MNLSKRFALLVVVVLFLGVFASETEDEDVGIDVALPEEEDDEIFQPSSDWKTIQPGQAIPAGLHVRMDLQTGKKEAKLLKEESSEKSDEEVILPRDQRRGIINKNRKIFTKKELADMLAKIPDDSDSSIPPALPDLSDKTTANRSNLTANDVESMLKTMGLSMRSEVEIMMTHIEILAEATASNEARLNALNELEFYVHQIDNARDLNAIGGLVLIVRCLNDTDAKIKSAAALVLGAAAQSNSAVQADCLEYEVMQLLLKELNRSDDVTVNRRFLFALSSLVRQYPPALAQFLQLNGLQTLTKYLTRAESGVLSLKSLTLVTDLLVEQRSGADETSSRITSPTGIRLLEMLRTQGWCQLTPKLLHHENDADRNEKILQAMDAIIQGCGSEFVAADVTKQVEEAMEKWKGALEQNDDGYYETLVDTATQFLNKLKHCEKTGLCA